MKKINRAGQSRRRASLVGNIEELDQQRNVVISGLAAMWLDSLARKVFPALFLVFNSAFWTIVAANIFIKRNIAAEIFND